MTAIHDRPAVTPPAAPQKRYKKPTPKPSPKPDLLLRQLLAVGAGPLLERLNLRGVSPHPEIALADVPDERHPDCRALISFNALSELTGTRARPLNFTMVTSYARACKLSGTVMLSYAGNEVRRWTATAESSVLPYGVFERPRASFGWGTEAELHWLLGEPAGAPLHTGPLTPPPSGSVHTAHLSQNLLPLARAVTTALQRGQENRAWSQTLHPHGREGLVDVVYAQRDVRAFPLLAESIELYSGLPLELALEHPDVPPATLMAELNREIFTLRQRGAWLPRTAQVHTAPKHTAPKHTAPARPAQRDDSAVNARPHVTELLTLQNWAKRAGLSLSAAKRAAEAHCVSGQHVIVRPGQDASLALRRLFQTNSILLQSGTGAPVLRTDVISAKQYAELHGVPMRVVHQAIRAGALKAAELSQCSVVQADAPWPPAGWDGRFHSIEELLMLAFGEKNTAERLAELQRHQAQLDPRLALAVEARVSGEITISATADLIGYRVGTVTGKIKEGLVRLIACQRRNADQPPVTSP